MGELPDFAGDSQHFLAVEVAVGDDVIEIRGFRLTRLHHGAACQPHFKRWAFFNW